MSINRLVVLIAAALTFIVSDAHAVYDAGTGRWLQRDPVGYVDGASMYQYGRANPLRYTDSTGLSSGPLDIWIATQFDSRWDVKDFIYHYYRPSGLRYQRGPFNPFNLKLGTGSTVDLGEVGRDNWYKNKAAVKKRIQACRDLAKKLKESMDAGGSCEPDYSSIDGLKDRIRGNEFEDAGVGFIIGGHGFKCNVRCTKESGKTKCSIDYSMRDRFKYPADTLNLINGPGTDIEPGGTPYDIIYDWSEDHP